MLGGRAVSCPASGQRSTNSERTRSLILVGVIVALSLMSCDADSGQHSGGTVSPPPSEIPVPPSIPTTRMFTSELYGFAFVPAEGWSLEEPDDRLVELHARGDHGGSNVPTFEVRVSPASVDVTLRQALHSQLVFLKSLPGIRIAGVRRTTLGSQPAFQILSLSTPDDRVTGKILQVVAASDELSVFMTYSADRDDFASHLSDARRMIRSFSFP